MKSQELISIIENVAPLAGQAPWDKSGVQIASRDHEVRKLALMLDPLPGPVEAAVDWGADFILTHHPLALEPRSLDAVTPFHDVVRLVIASRAWLYAAHTSLDVQPDGPVGWLARELGLAGLDVVDRTSREDEPPRGYGLIGDLPAEAGFDELCARIAKLAGRDFCLIYGPRPKTVSRLAYCPGSGSSLAAKALAKGAQVLVTGDMKYHPALELDICVLDVGHFSLEEIMLRNMHRLLADDPRCAGLDMRYFPGQDPQGVFWSGFKA